MHTLSHNKIKSQLRMTLPEYMIPVNFMHIEQIPITINGKLDKKALPIMDYVDTDAYTSHTDCNTCYAKFLQIFYM